MVSGGILLHSAWCHGGLWSISCTMEIVALKGWGLAVRPPWLRASSLPIALGEAWISLVRGTAGSPTASTAMFPVGFAPCISLSAGPYP